MNLEERVEAIARRVHDLAQDVALIPMLQEGLKEMEQSMKVASARDVDTSVALAIFKNTLAHHLEEEKRAAARDRWLIGFVVSAIPTVVSVVALLRSL